MKKNLSYVNCYMYRNKVYLQIPKGYKCVGIKVVDGKEYGKLKKYSLVPDLLILLWMLLIVYIIYNLPTHRQLINIPNEFYVTNNLLNIDVDNPLTNKHVVYIKIYSEDGDLLYDNKLNPGESIGAIEIDTNLKTYILEYTIKIWDFYEVSNKYRLRNANFQ